MTLTERQATQQWHSLTMKWHQGQRLVSVVSMGRVDLLVHGVRVAGEVTTLVAGKDSTGNIDPACEHYCAMKSLHASFKGSSRQCFFDKSSQNGWE